MSRYSGLLWPCCLYLSNRPFSLATTSGCRP
jgi:hypothetical protein